MTEKSETAERLARPLIRLAASLGVASSYIGQSGDYHEIDDDVLVAVLAALGVDASDEEAVGASLCRIVKERRRRVVAPTVLHVVGTRDSVVVNTGILEVPQASITLEDGRRYEGKLEVFPGDGSSVGTVDGRFVSHARIALPADLPVGYHTLHVVAGERSGDATLISAPPCITLPEAMGRGRLWGWMAQLYSIRSRASWGVGDYEDLRTMLVEAKQRTGADFILVNPLHAAEPVSPLTPSPYLPISRRFVNFTYIRPEAIEEYGALDARDKVRIEELRNEVEPLNGDAQIIDRDAMWRVKSQALRMVFDAGRTPDRQARFEEYKARVGDELESYATWCLCYERWGAPGTDAMSWNRRLDKDSAEVGRLRSRHGDSLEFYRWLEWVASQQLEDAQCAAKRAGMGIGIMSDMAVGVHPVGSDAWWHPERFAKGATVGAPPDYFNQQGQDWSQPPLNPIELERTGYKVYRDMVRGMFASAGAVRIDHILGLFRLWWIPDGRSAKDGAYVHYDSEAMLAILAIESSRCGGVVVGEDLGVVPPYVGESLERHGVLGCAVEWFEQRDGVFLPPSTWREHALASVDTHDLPPAAGYLAYEHVGIRERLHLLDCPVEEFRVQAVREHNAMLGMLIDQGFLDPALVSDETRHEQQIVEALHRALKASASRLIAAAIVDAVGERRAQNQPGTDNEYPNWRIPLADGKGNVVPLEGLFDHPRVRSLAAIMRE